MDNDIEIFKGKTFSSLCQDIYKNSQNNRNQVEVLISELRSLIKTLNDAIVIVPLIKDYLDVSIKNDDHLVKLAAIVQRLMSKQASSSDGMYQLTEEEKSQLLDAIGEVGADLDVSDIVSNAKKKIK
jgi:hypothetical protein